MIHLKGEDIIKFQPIRDIKSYQSLMPFLLRQICLNKIQEPSQEKQIKFSQTDTDLYRS